MAKHHRRSFSGSLQNDELQQHVLRTYFIMRVGIAIIGITLPFLLLAGGGVEHLGKQESMSAYYHAVGPGGGSMRNWFVGLLFAISICLGLYRGFSRTEDRLLNVAAVLGIGIAVCPSNWHAAGGLRCQLTDADSFCSPTLLGLPLHYTCAIAFFVCTALVCWFCADDTLSLVKSPARRRLLKRTYRAIAVLMPTAMLAAWVVNTLRDTKTSLFWIEAVGVVAFGLYWLLKGFELRHTAADLMAASGKLRQNEGVVELV